mmetsp:Transcript_391/g.464  ORF Transcript_391/g.464 Transcript_391/m.464 type:complete len:198 (-) Transcript_391:1525-2118(-)
MVTLGGGFGTQSTAGDKSLFVLAGEGNIEAVQSVIEGPNSPGVNAQDENGYSLLMAAAGWGKLSMVEYLLGAGADVNLVDSDGDSCLHHCSTVTCMKLLVSRGADSSLRNSEGQTPLDSMRQNLAEELGEDDEDEEDETANQIVLNQEDLSRLQLGTESEPEQEVEQQPGQFEPSEDAVDSEEIQQLRGIIAFLESQ